MVDKIFIKEMLVNGLMELENKKKVVGVLIKCLNTGNVFLLYRNDSRPTWALVSGTIESGEDVLDALKREISEELSINPNIISYDFVNIEHIIEKKLDFYYYRGFVKEEFTPTLDTENLDFGWFSKDNLPSPLFQDLYGKIKNI